MTDFITLTCPTCGGKLQITSDIDRFACSYCGTEHIVKRGRGIVTLAPVIEGIRNVQVGVDRTASELAIKRLKEEIASLESQIWIAKRNNQVKIENALKLIFIVAIAAGFSYYSGGIYREACVGPYILILLGASISLFNLLLGRSLANEIAPLEDILERKYYELRQHQKVVSIGFNRRRRR